jgi:hypothetical protein
MLLKLFHEVKKKGPSTTPETKPDKDTAKKENYGPISL